MTTQKTTWYTVVGFGDCYNTGGEYRDKEAALERRTERAQADSSGWSFANSRVYGYSSRAAARRADISHDLGKNGRIF